MERGDVDAAEKLLGDAVKACPTDIDARRQYAEALWQSGQRDRALEQIEKCLSLSPDDTSLMVRAGEMQLSLGSLDKALHFADQSLDIDPHEPRAWRCAPTSNKTPANSSRRWPISTALWNSTTTIANCCLKPPSCTGN